MPEIRPPADRSPAPDAFDIPPSLPRLVQLPLIVATFALALLVLSTLGADTWADGLARTAPYLALGVGLTLYRYLRRHRPVLRIDRTGVSGPDGHRLHTWTGTIQVWVGPSPDRWVPRRLRVPVLMAWTEAGLDFARRARFRPTPALSVPVATDLTVDELAAAVRRCTDAPVVTAAQLSLRELNRRLLPPGPPLS